MSSIVILLRSRSFRVAGIGPVSIITGSTPTVVWSTIRRAASAPSSWPSRRDISSTAAAPSEICDELPAVTLPSSLKAGFSAESASRLVSGRIPWSVSYVSAVDLDRHDLALEAPLFGRLVRRAGASAARTRPAPSAGSPTGRRSSRRQMPWRHEVVALQQLGGHGAPTSSTHLNRRRSGVAHVLDAAADHDVVDAGGDQRGAEVDGLLGGSALAVDGRRGRLDGSPACSQALRPMLKICSPYCCTQPADDVLDLHRRRSPSARSARCRSCRAARWGGCPCSSPSPGGRARSACGPPRR